MTPAFVGSSPYRYANSPAMILGPDSPPFSAVEVLTGSSFGAQFTGSGLPCFDPPGWDPDLGLDQAVRYATALLDGPDQSHGGGGEVGQLVQLLQLVEAVELVELTGDLRDLGPVLGGDVAHGERVEHRDGVQLSRLRGDGSARGRYGKARDTDGKANGGDDTSC